MTLSNPIRTLLGLALLMAFGTGVFVYYRVYWSFNKRLREVAAGKLYRSGQLTAAGFRETIRDLGIKSVVNLQDEFPDPDIVKSWYDHSTIKEQALCAEMGVKYIHLMPDLISRNAKPGDRPKVIEGMLAAYDDKENYPMLVHCKAGLHRTGVLIAVYRMEYEGWSPDQAYREMRDHGYGDKACTEANDYVREYVLEYQPGQRKAPVGVNPRALRTTSIGAAP
ncbi:MAG: dual specificity protein phosphatase family protein [Gemmataceae bacterium]